MTSGIRIVDGVSKWIRESIGAAAANRGDDHDEASDKSNGADEDDEVATEDSDRAESDYDSPACCSAASSTDVTVLEE